MTGSLLIKNHAITQGENGKIGLVEIKNVHYVGALILNPAFSYYFTTVLLTGPICTIIVEFRK